MAPNLRRDFLKQTTATAALGLMTASTGSARSADPPGSEAYLCVNCGTQYPPSARPPEHCPICEDDREFVGFDGQKWPRSTRSASTARTGSSRRNPACTRSTPSRTSRSGSGRS